MRCTGDNGGMAFQFEKWLNYTKAKIQDAVGSGNKKLDELEAKREADRAEKPWLTKDGDDPSFDQVKARIEWQEAQAKKAAEMTNSAKESARDLPQEPASPPGVETPAKPEPPAKAGPAESTPDTSGAHAKPLSTTGIGSEAEAAAEAEMARLQQEERERESLERLDKIRAELGIQPADPSPEDPPKPA